MERDKAVNFRENLGVYFRISRPYWLYFVAIILFVLFVSLSSVAEKYLFKVILDDGANFVAGTLLKDAFVQILFGVAVAYVFIVAVRGVSHWLRYYFINRLEGSQIFELKKKYFSHILRLSHKFHTSHRTGSLISRMTRGARSIEGITDFFVFSTMPLLIQLVVVCISLVYFEVFSVVVVILTMVAVILFVMLITQKQQVAKIKANDADDEEKAFVGDSFVNIDTVKYFGKEVRISQLFEGLAKKSTDTIVKTWDYEGLIEVGQSVILSIGVALLLYFPLVKFLSGELSIGSLAFIYTLYFNIAEPMFAFMYGIRRFYESMADFQSLREYERVKVDVPDKEGAKDVRISKGEIRFDKVSFTYHKKKVIDDFDLLVKPREKVAFVGHSGSGKTTLVKLLYRFYDVDSGRILIDNKDISQIKQESLRSELSIVPQEGMLFNDTIFNNVAFSKPNASREDVINALKAAQLYEFVESLPEKENTYVGERGIKLSGGEKQRLSVARAVLADKKILVLDEATSALDSQTEFLIQKALDELMKGRTTIIIAHRLSTIMRADRIVVLSRGKIAQVGTHTELINQDGIYKKLWNMQKGGYIE